MRQLLICLAALVFPVAPLAVAQSAAELSHLDEMADLMTGSFTTLPQAETDERYGVVESEVVRIWQERDDGVWLYQENAWMGDTPDTVDEAAKQRPYFQRIIHLEAAGPGAVRRTAYRVTDPAAALGGWQSPNSFPEGLTGDMTCTAVGARVGEGYWYAELDCANALRGAIRTISRSIYTPTDHVNWDRGFDPQGSLVWGPADGGYVFTSIEQSEPRRPIDLRRTTLVVRDMETSLAFYRDALGLQVVYDQELTSPRLGRTDTDGVNRSRLVLLTANDPNIGAIGLWQFLDQTEHDRAPVPERGFVPGDIVLLFNTSELDTVFPAAAAVPGVQVIGEPVRREYPADGFSFVVMVSMLADPDGHIVELNNRISPPIDWD